MHVKTIEDAKALIGTTWERDGKRRTVTRIEGLRISGWDNNTLCGNVYWRRPDGAERKLPQWLSYFLTWLSMAVQVNEKAAP